jgi:hypothetical protein
MTRAGARTAKGRERKNVSPAPKTPAVGRVRSRTYVRRPQTQLRSRVVTLQLACFAFVVLLGCARPPKRVFGKTTAPRPAPPPAVMAASPSPSIATAPPAQVYNPPAPRYPPPFRLGVYGADIGSGDTEYAEYLGELFCVPGASARDYCDFRAAPAGEYGSRSILDGHGQYGGDSRRSAPAGLRRDR